MRQVVLDTETTGLEHREGHRVIEIGCVELVNRRLTRRNYHQYLQPDREIDPGAIEIHGITNEYLADKPRFADIVEDLMSFIDGAELIIHNAPFDTGFLNHELRLLDSECKPLDHYCNILDTLAMARKMHPGQKNSLDALCRRYDVDNSGRELHGALLDAEILADVYLAMTGGQAMLSLDEGGGADDAGQRGAALRRLPADRAAVPVLTASEAERSAHEQYLDRLDQGCAEGSLWRREPGERPPS